MHILLTNDDGIDAPGLAALESALDGIGTLTVVAPHAGYSGCGHQVTSYEPVRVEKVGDRRYKVFGTPADCTRLGLTVLTAGSRPDLVVAGVNAGGNLGVDVFMSGTVAAIREAVWLGTPGIAFSQFVRSDRERDWEKSAAMARRAFMNLVEKTVDKSSYWNVNFPDVDTPVEELAITDTFAEPTHLPVHFEPAGNDAFRFQSDYRNRPRIQRSDVEVCFGGAISVSKLSARP